MTDDLSRSLVLSLMFFGLMGAAAPQAADPMTPGVLGAVAADEEDPMARDDDGDDDELEVEDIFGFTEGGGTDDAGEREISNTTVIGFDRRSEAEGVEGSGDLDYFALESETEFEYSLTDQLTVSTAFTTVYFDMDDGDELDNNTGGLGGLSIGAKYGMLKAGEDSPVNLAVAGELEWKRYSEETGEEAAGYEGTFGIFADTALIEDTLFGAANLSFSTETSESDEGEGWEDESGLEASLALSYQIADGVFLGAETRLAGAFEGAALDENTGYALYVGPTFYASLGEDAYLKAAWATQVAGHSNADPDEDLDLVDFDRNQLLVGLGFSF